MPNRTRTETKYRETHMVTVDLGIEDTDRVIELLNRNLADENVLYIKTKNYHWNLEGAHFHDWHKFLGEQYETLDSTIDAVAERVRAIGGRAIGTLEEFLDRTRLGEKAGEAPEAREMFSNLLGDHETVIKNLRDDIKACQDVRDEGTMDLLIKTIQTHEKTAWMIRAVLAGEE